MTATAPAEELLITEPGIYTLPVDAYHRDPVAGGSLSSTGVRKLLPPSCPALFHAWQIGPPEEKRTFDYGRAAHREVLGAGDDVVVVEGSGADHRWLSDATKAKVKAVRDSGRTPVKPQEAEQITAMADVLRTHTVAAALLEPGTGEPEQTLVWQDEETGIWRRALLDWCPHPVAEGRRLLVPDYKTVARLDRESIARAIAEYGYHVQGRYYLDAVQALAIAGRIDPAFLLILQMKTEPYLVAVVQLDLQDLTNASVEIRHALHLYRWCTRHDYWPGYADHEVLSIATPAWHRYQHEAAVERGALETDIDSIYTPQLEVPEQ